MGHFSVWIRECWAAAARVIVIVALGATSLSAQGGPAPVTAEPEGVILHDSQLVDLLVGRSTIVQTDNAITRVSLTNPNIGDALVTGSNQLLLNGKAPGTTSMFIWDNGGLVHRYEIAVGRDLVRLSEQLHLLFPTEQVQAYSNGRQIVLAGTVSNKDVIASVVNVASGYVGSKDDVVALLQTAPSPRSAQVLLRVRFAEVSRSALSELGMNLFTSPTGINNTIGSVTTQQFTAPKFSDFESTKTGNDFGDRVVSSKGSFTFSDFLNIFLYTQRYDLGVVIRALQAKGLFESLAEPNVVAESGKEASFLAGGEFPIPVAQGNSNAVSVTYKEYGVRLTFTPTIVDDRIHLKVAPEVSMLDFANAVAFSGFRIPALSSRRTETEVELANGQTFAIAGLMNSTMNSTLRKIPGIGDIPILGRLFQSKEASRNRTELVVMITPEILATNSPGVTASLPRIGEQFLPALPENKSTDMPPPPFTDPSKAP